MTDVADKAVDDRSGIFKVTQRGKNILQHCMAFLVVLMWI
jgi:hypothetical protein